MKETYTIKQGPKPCDNKGYKKVRMYYSNYLILDWNRFVEIK